MSDSRIRHFSAAALGFLLASFVPTIAGAAAPVSVENGSKAQRADADRLRAQIKQLTQQSPFTVEKAPAILGAQKGTGGQTSKVNFEWQLTPTDLIDGGRIGTVAGKPYVDVKPASRLGLTFEDVAAMFLDAPYAMREQRIHPFQDSMSIRTRGIHHSFLVPAGELDIFLLSTAPYTAHLQMSQAWGEGREAAWGVAPANLRPLTSVIVSLGVGPLGEKPKTLAKMRADEAARRARVNK